MEHIGIDLGKMHSQVAILTSGGELIERRIPSERTRLTALMQKHPKAKVLMEASTDSEWVARLLEELGHEVIVADPNYAPMYAQRSRKVKTDRRDARALVEACRLGAYRPAHRSSDAQRHVRGQVTVREAMVRARARAIVLIGALMHREGMRLQKRYSVEMFATHVAALPLPDHLRQQIAPLLPVLDALTQQIRVMDHVLKDICQSDPRVARLCTVPGVGPVTAVSFVAAVDRIERFQGAHELEAYFGLVPREMSSGEKQRRGHITKAGNSRVRALLVEAAWCILRLKTPETAVARQWAERIAARRGKSRAAVALARRLAGILYAMMRDGTVYQPNRVGAPQHVVPYVAA